MNFGGRYVFAADRHAVWAALNDIRVLRAVIPGCEEIRWTSAETLDLKIKVNLGVVHPVFSGELILSNVLPAEHYTLSGRGRGPLGLAQGAADIQLADAADGTLLSFSADGKADGGVMRIGKTLIGRSAQKVIDGFFEAIGREMGTTVTVAA